MNVPENTAAEQAIDAREAGLHRELSARQISMIALGGAIGTGLFLGSAVSVKLAGPGVILSYAAASLIALALMWALAEMTLVHPVAGSFGVFAEIYLHPWAGFSIRYAYWLATSVAIGSEVVAISIYCRYWFPEVPAWVWMLIFSAAIIGVNAASVGNFGTLEYWFALIKVMTIVAFLLLGAALAFRDRFPTARHGELHRLRRISAAWMDRRRARRGDRHLQLYRGGSGRGGGRRSERTARGHPARDALDHSAAGDFLYRRDRGARRRDAVDAGGPDRKPVRARVRDGENSARGGANELRRADRGAFEHEFEPVSHIANDFLAIAWRIRAAIYRPAEFARRAAGCVTCVEYRAGHRAAGGAAIPGNGIRVHARRIFLRRPLRLVHHIPHASGIPAEAGA